MKSEILDDYAAPFAPGPLAGPGAALSGTTHHWSQRHFAR